MQSYLTDGETRLARGDILGAYQVFKTATQDHPQDPEAWYGWGRACHHAQKLEMAEQAFLTALNLGGDQADIANQLSAIDRAFGRFEQAETRLRQALSTKPHYHAARYNLATLRRYAREEALPQIADIDVVLRGGGLSVQQTAQLKYAAGKLWDDADEPDQAWPLIASANEIEAPVFDRNRVEQLFRRTLSGFTKSIFENAAHGVQASGTRTAFIVGMPRSGSTLAERILATSDAFPAGELHYLSLMNQQFECRGQAWPDYALDLSSDQVHALGQAYRQEVTRLSKGAGLVIDKALPNYLFVGLIRQILPDSPIVWTRRAPEDTALSCFFTRFPAGMPYTFSLSDLAFMEVWQEKVMQHWAEVCGPVHELNYERLVDSPLESGQALLTHCGLGESDSIEAFHTLEHPVQTASAWQVRQPLNRNSLGRANRYRHHMAPYREAYEQFREVAFVRTG